ncbi:MAG TPA: NAD(P)/FAD-dependent oxidoreductase [Terriglobales bacterium]|nr:NAD(P)/FAD-dependent oxidoreductase [Terriglobales bacterium]
MPNFDPIAIVGGGPAGTVAATALARGGKSVILFDEKLAWEKPCGGGVTHKALLAWPFLRETNVERNWVGKCELRSNTGRRACFSLEHPIAIFSRTVLNGLLLQRARDAGAVIASERIISVERSQSRWKLRSANSGWSASYVIFASGARNPFRKQFCDAFAPADLMVTAGYRIPRHSEPMQIQFLHDFHGYIWIFPRSDHVSAGICGKMNAMSTRDLRVLLEENLEKQGLDYHGAQFYSHVLPSLRAKTLREAPVSGHGWAMVGDAAGFVDGITGEGLYYAMRSGELIAQALLADRPELYLALLRSDFLPELELAAQMAIRFYTGRWMGESVVERTLQFVASSASFRSLMSDLFAGTQSYRSLRPRLYCTLPTMLAESLATALRLPTSDAEAKVESRAS